MTVQDAFITKMLLSQIAVSMEKIKVYWSWGESHVVAKFLAEAEQRAVDEMLKQLQAIKDKYPALT